MRKTKSHPESLYRCSVVKKKKSLDVSGGFGGGWDRMVELLAFPLQPLSRWLLAISTILYSVIIFSFFFNIPSPCLVLLSTEHRDKKGEGIGVCWPQCKCCETLVAILTIMWYWRVRSGGWRQLTWAPRHVTRAHVQPSQLGCKLSCDWPACLRLILTAARNAFCDVFAAPCFVRLIKSIILHTFYE